MRGRLALPCLGLQSLKADVFPASDFLFAQLSIFSFITWVNETSADLFQDLLHHYNFTFT